MGDRYTEQGGGTSFGRTGGINVHGARSLQNNFLLDGVDNNSISENVQELTSQVSRPSVDAIQEFKVVTSPYSAEYGRSPGAAVSVSTKSGTNDFRGTAYEFFRNESMDSIDFFSKRADASKPANDQNQFGGNLGGPMIKDNAFFFLDYEGTRITRGVTRLTRVPTADERAGIFSTRDPQSGDRRQFRGQQDSRRMIDPYAAAIIALVPLPNQAGANNFFRLADIIDDSDRLSRSGRLAAELPTTVFSAGISTPTAAATSPGPSAGSSTARARRRLAIRQSKPTRSSAAGPASFRTSMVNEVRVSWSQV